MDDVDLLQGTLQSLKNLQSPRVDSFAFVRFNFCDGLASNAGFFGQRCLIDSEQSASCPDV